MRASLIPQTSRVVDAALVKATVMATTLPPSRRPRAHVIPDEVDRNVFAPLPREEARRALDWPSDEQVVLFGANPANPRKGFALARAASDIVAERVPNLRLRVAFPISPDLMPLHLCAANCLIVTSWVEGSPNIVKEALAVNLPVVTVDIGDTAEICRDVASAAVCSPILPRWQPGSSASSATRPRRMGARRPAGYRRRRSPRATLAIYQGFGVTSASLSAP
jgi:glycosyltransferase involved in cell wall biosynthesis